MTQLTRRQLVLSATTLCSGAPLLLACSPQSQTQTYEAATAQTWRADTTASVEGVGTQQELVRCATLAPSSHNTQCWQFGLEAGAITVLPDLSRRCPAVDPDDHHLFVSLGCALENLHHAALAHGLHDEAQFDTARDAVRLALSPTTAQATPLFNAIATRQCTRGAYDGKALSSDELAVLERAGTSSTVRVLLLTERAAMERVLEHVVQGNTAQMADPAFVKELKTWIRFSGAEAVRTRDGLFSLTSGNPSGPTWLGSLLFDWFFTPKRENDKIAHQIRSSAGIAVFVGQAADKAHWVDVGRAYERFALQAAALGIRNAFLNQPVEVAAQRPPFADAVGLAGQRPDLVVRFGRGPLLPRSLRRPLQAVLL